MATTNTMRGVVLAAGEGRRMGGAKALLEIEGITLVERHVGRLVEVGCSSVVVVTRPSVEAAVAARLQSVACGDAHVSIRCAATRSQAHSLAAALDAPVGSRGDILFITPVDMLPADVGTHHALLAALTGSALAVTPVYAGRGGHPVLVFRSLLSPYETPRETPHDLLPSLRDVLAEAGDARRRVEVGDASVLGDLDTPADVAALTSRVALGQLLTTERPLRSRNSS